MDRQETLRRAEKLVNQGKIDAAIVEYQRALDEQPRDFSTANLLGELYLRVGQVDRAVAHYSRIADQFRREGFLPRAAALYKKIIKIKPDDEQALLQSAEISAQQGLLADAKTYLHTLAQRRARQGDRRGAADVALRIARLDPEDIQAQIDAARVTAEIGDLEGAKGQYRKAASEAVERKRFDGAITLLREAARIDPLDAAVQEDLVRALLAAGHLDDAIGAAGSGPLLKEVAVELQRRGRQDEALTVFARALASNPLDTAVRLQLGRAHIARRDLTRAAATVTAEAAGDDPDLLLMLAEIELRGKQVQRAGQVLRTLLQRDPRYIEQIVQLGCALAESLPEAGFACIDAAVATAMKVRDLDGAIVALEKYVDRAPHDISALMRLVEISSDGGFDHNLYDAQVRLVDALLRAERWADARPWAEAVVVRRPDETANLDRLGRVLIKLGVPNPERIIADCVNPPAIDEIDAAPRASAPLAPSVQPDVAPAKASSAPVRPVAPVMPSDKATAPPASRRTPPVPNPVGLAPGRPDEPVYELQSDGVDWGDILDDDAGVGSVEREAFLEVDLSAALDDLALAEPTSPPDARQPTPTESMKDRPPSALSEDQDLDDVFKDFRDELSRQTSADESAEQLKLGLTYRDMGMIDQAVTSLEVAARAPSLRFDAASTLARIARDRGSVREAIEWFERAAEAPGPTVEAGQSLLYELADLLEGSGEQARALAVFLELRAQAPSYRDVSSRVDRLSKER